MATKRFSPTRTITQKNLEKVPGDKPGVYRIKNASNEILYIGKAKGGRLPERIAEHKGEFKGGAKFQYKTATSSAAAESLECQEIKKYRPPRNKDK